MDKKCSCPLCNQAFEPSEGLTAEQHLAKGIIRTYKDMQQSSMAFELPCPCCGHNRMNPVLEENAISRHCDVYICSECTIKEEMQGYIIDELSITTWYMVNELLKTICGLKCPNYLPEKNNPYPLCDNTECKESKTCNCSAHMDESKFYKE